MRVIFAGGGTAGHINPAIAIANYIMEKDKGSKVLFVGTKKGLEQTLVPKAGYKIVTVEAEGIRRNLTIKNIKSLYKAATAYFKSKKIIKDFKPDIVVGTGGYVSGPVVAAAARMKIPTLIHEENVFAGMTTKMLSSMVDVVTYAFSDSKGSLSKAKKLIHTGNPIKRELFKMAKGDARLKLGVRDKPFIVAFGGSLGADKINESVLKFIKYTLHDNNYQLLFATGERNYEEVIKKYKASNYLNDNVKIVPYIYNMDEVMVAADIVIARAGAITLSEINALGKAAILIPSPNVTDNHQEHNARALEKAGAAIVITENELIDSKVLTNKITSLLNNEKELKNMESKSLEMGIKDATEQIYKEIKTLTSGKS